MIKDTAYAALFAKKDLPSLYQLAEKIRTTHDQTLVDDFNLKCQKKIDDHNPVLDVGNQKIEFVQVSKADDLVTTVGINLLLDQILGVNLSRWRYMAAGVGTTAPAIGQTTLVTYSNNSDMSLAGWREYAGPTLKFAGIFGERLLPTLTITEAGIFPAAGGVGTMLNRNMFSNNPVNYVVNITAMLISSIIEFVPVMS